MLITYQKLRNHGACLEQLGLLEETFPEFRKAGIEITADNLMTAYEAGVNLLWFMYEFVPSAIYTAMRTTPMSVRQRQRTEFVMTWSTVLTENTIVAFWLTRYPTQDQLDEYELMHEVNEAATACELMACILSYAEQTDQ